MKCPNCKTDTLQFASLAQDLPARECFTCRGVWIPSHAYMTWLRMKPNTEEVKVTEPFDPAWDTNELKLCPDCGRILARYKVFPNVAFHLDRCGSCNGIWFDHNEWEALAARRLHDNLHEFFTKPWQERIRAEETRARMEQIYLDKFGADGYARLKEMRAWLKEHPHQSMMLAFLQADDPWKV